jgi:hypothetical protein
MAKKQLRRLFRSADTLSAVAFYVSGRVLDQSSLSPARSASSEITQNIIITLKSDAAACTVRSGVFWKDMRLQQYNMQCGQINADPPPALYNLQPHHCPRLPRRDLIKD